MFSYQEALVDATSNSGAKVDTLELSKFWPDGSRDYHTKCSKSYIERQILCDISYRQNLKKWYK